MPLGFLVPLFLAGLAAVAIPIWVHLTRKQRSLVVPFPSLMFLQQVPFKEDRRRTLHHWLLLALRALVIVLLVAAFARPFFEGDSALAVAGTGPREVVVLLEPVAERVGRRRRAELDVEDRRRGVDDRQAAPVGVRGSEQRRYDGIGDGGHGDRPLP